MCSSGSSIVLIRCSSDTQFYIYILYLERDAIQLVAQEAASTFGSFSYNNTASWVHLLNPEVYHTAPYRYKEGNFQLKDFIPISLLYKGFGNFLKLYTSQDPSNIDLDDMKFLQSFIISMAMIYPSEEDRNKAALKALNDYIGIKYTIFGPTKNADGVMLLNRRVVLLFEGKNEQCSTGYDPEMQSICYYSKYIEENFESSPSPSIIIIISGPNISIVGIINGTLHVIVENLVPTLRLAYIPGSHITNSLCFCFKALKAFISEASEDQFDATSDYPYFTSFKHLNCDATLEYICNLKRLVYVAKMIWTETENNTKHEDFVIVKFTNTYGVEAHKWMADKGGMAPQFIAIHDLPPNWKVVIMEKLHTIDTDVNYDVVRKVIKEFHEAGFVHGDLRPSNIISCSNTKLGIAVIDYDWAGKANEAKYPLWMNPACIWPQNASCGQIITADHDNHWLQQGSTLDADI